MAQIYNIYYDYFLWIVLSVSKERKLIKEPKNLEPAWVANVVFMDIFNFQVIDFKNR